jgi:hypothetical protein
MRKMSVTPRRSGRAAGETRYFYLLASRGRVYGSRGRSGFAPLCPAYRLED